MTSRAMKLGGLFLIGMALALTGCQQSPVVDAMPAPSFNSPTIAPPKPVVVQALPPVAPPVAARPLPRPARPGAIAGIPRDWIPNTQVRPWRWIIIHHSDSAYGSAAIIDKWHRDRGFDELGYHFVIGNGTNSGDGQIEVGPRWAKQKWGAHDNAADNRYNEFGIGICLVGNFDKQRPTEAQKRSLVRLVAYLMRTYHVPADRVLGHGETKQTDCPGRYLNVTAIRQSAARMVAESGDNVGSDAVAVGGEELMTNEGK